MAQRYLSNAKEIRDKIKTPCVYKEKMRGKIHTLKAKL